ncbi:sugar ABC transporter substrate-binding protein [Paracoccus denitrificans]|jgi:ribose transport system substrate-binding protein|uniref:Monosaccharide ABC transporter substrate-binding protein, CUT2 family n=1 Tax=Paracoccus denitrificans (strain Pd 1222) TaxID=318586 RepID=A1AYL7_PARDP|nr:substrate-binding domain-containing protein [Paracoccus denitrificans]ABL68361.1 monosaccharide ABC transporter substrate-binding protein, CUT2 family [Paracoccus denitrificans PD1222]MBB4627877.1 ribose transport system substrate-binding protein [Paracoccus denitrificans]MCU7428588.1 substrate-binding domain-containing protein [Paracoccus denitrificans]QAR26443.1 ABC transporter substrate-binding protein [Paracoccus denitrificans]UPV95379.1 substrate-binding domain-containing protein [Para
MTTIKSFLLASALTAFGGIVMAQDLAPLNSDEEPDRMDWSELTERFGDLPKPTEGTQIGGVSKALTNEYWRSLGEGYKNMTDAQGVGLAYQAAPSEGDQLGQLSIAENMILQGYQGLLVSPQTDNNLQPAMETAASRGIAVVNVNDAVIPSATQYVGNVQRDNGVRVAQWFIDNRPGGGKVAAIEGQPGVFAAGQRTDGFTTTITEAGNFQVVASVPANWSREQAYDAASTILQQHPDLIGFYANNDGMALGVVEAVKAANLQEQVSVFGTDGIPDAYASIRAGDLTGTVDSFPVLTGEVAMEVVLRLLAGQGIPRVVATPQALITADNVADYSVEDSTALREKLLAE